MAPKIDKREDGLRELASMIAETYRHRETDEIISPLNASDNDDSNPVSEDEIIVRIEPTDSRSGFVYTETVAVENFIRNKKRQGNHEEINTRDSKGGQNVADKRNIRDRKAAQAGQNQAGD